MVSFPWYDPELEEVHFELDRGHRTYEIICPGGFLPQLVYAIQTGRDDQIRTGQELSAFIKKTGKAEFEKFEEEHADLESYLRTWCFRLTKRDGVDMIQPCLDRTPLYRIDEGIELSDPQVPSFDWKTAKVIHPWSGFCSKVKVGDQVLNSFLVCNLPFWREEFCFYLERLKRISLSSSEASKRAPQLKGILRSTLGRVHGRLENFVHGPKLHELAIEKISPDRRERWGTQILETVLSLHALDVLWGGYRRSLLEVTIDAQDNAHIGEIAGGVWVMNNETGELELTPFTTKEEDLKAVVMLHDFLRVGELFRLNPGRIRSTVPTVQPSFEMLPCEVRLHIYEYFVQIGEDMVWTVDGLSSKRLAQCAQGDSPVGLEASRWKEPPLALANRAIRREILAFLTSYNVFHVECCWIPGFLGRLRICADSLRQIVLTLELSRNEELQSAQIYGLNKLLLTCRSLTSVGLVLSHQRNDILMTQGWWERDPVLLMLRNFRGIHSFSLSSIRPENVIPFRRDIKRWLQEKMFEEA
ncbi:hypothetical protein B0J12DRAFT_705643 [Macrophomina phaseolina]|uniref:Uncharacterized protein n=1 Tax=Macrophomina phaseolina TaxID=35725 RepID=A0ABQ8FRG6_9PEZI|nr:hypothetical protein B0J12DRAFT_705643 [Macrophomina phaseolina]